MTAGIELEVEVGTFTVRRQTDTVDWDETIVWIEWYDPEKNLLVKTRYDDAWTDQGVVELSAYDLVE